MFVRTYRKHKVKDFTDRINSTSYKIHMFISGLINGEKMLY